MMGFVSFGGILVKKVKIMTQQQWYKFRMCVKTKLEIPTLWSTEFNMISGKLSFGLTPLKFSI